MHHFSIHWAQLLVGVAVLPCGVWGFLDIGDPETEDPSIDCILGASPNCELNNFSGLNGHPVIELLYSIIQESTLPNDTIFKNEDHVACLFKDRTFAVDMGVDAEVTFDLDWESDGTVCLFTKENPSGGLSLGEIRKLTEGLLKTCDTCGSISVNYYSQNVSQLGWVEVDWQDPADCQPPCIDAERDLNGGSKEDDPADQPSGAGGQISGLHACVHGGLAALAGCAFLFLGGAVAMMA